MSSNKKIKVLRIIARLNIGGPSRHVAILNEGLDKDKYESILVYGSLEPGEGDMSYLAKNVRGRVVYVPEITRRIRPLSDLKAFMKIFALITKERPQIVHTHTAKAGAIGRLAAILAFVPIKVHTFHGNIFYGYFSRWATALFLWIERFLAFFTDRIICISNQQKDELLKTYRIGTEKKYEIINLGFDLEKFMNAKESDGSLRSVLNLKSDDILVGIVGRLVSVKNHMMFLKAAERIKKTMDLDLFSKVKFIIIGDGPERPMLENYVKSVGLERGVIFAGWAKEMEKIYADLDIVALTSKNEGTPLSLIEALASSKPVIATNVGGVKDVVGDAAILVETNEEEKFAASLSDLIKSNQKRKEMGLKGRERVVQRFSKENLIKSTEKLYEELLKEKGI